jgi:WD40 repeat protein
MDTRGEVRWIASLIALFLSLAASTSPASAAIRSDGRLPPRAVWLATYDGPTQRSDEASDVATSPDGEMVFVTGAVNHTESATTVAYEAATGVQLWVASYDGPGGNGAVGSAIEVASDSALVFVTGYAFRSFDQTDFVTIAYDAATGTERWVSLYDGPAHGDDSATALDVSPDGTRVVVTGLSYATGGNGDYLTAAYDADTGTQLWVTRHDVIGSYDVANDISFDPTGTRAFVTGWGYVAIRPYDTAYRTVAYDAATGTQLWVADYQGPGGFNNSFDSASAVAVDPDGTVVFVTGDSDGPFQEQDDYATVAYAASSGVQLWASRYDGPQHSFDYAYDIGLSPDGTRVFVTGDSYGAGGTQDFATVAYDAATGAELWATRFDGGGISDLNPRLVVPRNGTIVAIAGTSVPPGASGGLATFLYDAATGAQRWGSIIGTRRAGGSNEIAVSSDGSMLFVTGSWNPTIDNMDYGTIGYRLG